MVSFKLSSATLILGLFALVASNPLPEKSTFEIRRRDSAEITAPILLGNAATYTIFASTGISTVAGDIGLEEIVIGDIGVGPIELTAITGFGTVSEASPIVPAFITGKTYGPLTTGPQDTDGAVRAAFKNAYTDNVASTVNSNLATNYLDDNNKDLLPGVYQFVGTLVINKDIVLTGLGSTTAVYVFQAAGAISTGAHSSVTLVNGLLASNVYWVSATSFTSGVASTWMGIILTRTNVVIAGSLTGRVFSQTGVALHHARIVLPDVPASAPLCILVPGRDVSCDANGNVNACSLGYGINQNTGTCVACPTGSFSTLNFICAPCPRNSLTCDSHGVTLTCKNTYGLSYGVCRKCVGNQGSDGTAACIDCTGGLIGVFGTCQLCGYGLATCMDNAPADCLPGFRYQVSTNTCAPCFYGETSAGAGVGFCTSCAIGTVSGLGTPCSACDVAVPLFRSLYAGSPQLGAFTTATRALCV